jgi:hypothetical protein
MDDDTFVMFVLGDDPTEALREAVERLCADGLLQYDSNDLRLTAAGLRVLLNHSKSIAPLFPDKQESTVR